MTTTCIGAYADHGRAENYDEDLMFTLTGTWLRCENAGIPLGDRTPTSKNQHALDIVRRARARGMRFEWVGVDAGYGKEPAFLRALDDSNECSSPMPIAPNGFGPNSPSYRFHRRHQAAVRRASGRPRGNPSRWKAWSDDRGAGLR
jgi:hypothetical protein